MRATAKAKREGQLTPTSFDLLLSKLGDEPYEAGLRYERLRGRLILFFLRRLLPASEDLADETIDRLARRLFEGEEIASIEAYALGVARFVAQEQAAFIARETNPSKNFWENIWASDTTKGNEALDHDLQLDAMEQCLALLPQPEIQLLTDYYLVEGERKIEARRLLAQRHGITSGALRKKIFGICNGLRDCIRTRTASPTVPAPRSSSAGWSKPTP